MTLTLLTQETVQSIGILRLRDICKSTRGLSCSRINNCSASLRRGWTGSGCESLALGWPPTPASVPGTT